LHAQQPAPDSPINLDDQALAELRQHHPQEALSLLQRQITADPKDATANLLAASCAIELGQPNYAVEYGERARTLDPDSWKIHTTLVTAYSIAGKTQKRDAERATLRTLHIAAKEPDAARASGFLLDEFKLKQYSIDAVEYFAPVGKYHIYYRFIVRTSTGERVWQIDVESDELNQVSWAKAHAEQAAEGQRQYQVIGESDGVRTDYTSFSGTLDYDVIKARVLAIINAQTAPFAGEAASHPG
jgi:tetratricopeptide (TPR) repeat protein